MLWLRRAAHIFHKKMGDAPAPPNFPLQSPSRAAGTGNPSTAGYAHSPRIYSYPYVS